LANGLAGSWHDAHFVLIAWVFAGFTWHRVHTSAPVGCVNAQVVPRLWHRVQGPRSACLDLWQSPQAVEVGWMKANGFPAAFAA
jgi:hypothetical protein